MSQYAKNQQNRDKKQGVVNQSTAGDNERQGNFREYQFLKNVAVVDKQGQAAVDDFSK